jgi:hypothetical protein
VLLLVVGCRARLAREPAAGGPPFWGEDPGPGAYGPADAFATLLDGVEGLAEAVRGLEPPSSGAEARPRVTRLRALEQSAAQRYRTGGFGGPVRSLVACGVCGRVPVPPSRVADLIQDPEVERRLLAADEVTLVRTVYAVPGQSRRVHRVRLRAEGLPGMRLHFDFHGAVERWDLPDGTVLLRYDPEVEPRPRHVTLWRGGCWIRPDGEGALVSEVLLLGSDVALPGPLRGLLVRRVFDTLENRAINLWVRARALAGE